MRQWMARWLCSQRDSVFEEMNSLAREVGAVNLGSGTPGELPPEVLRAAAAEAIASGRNQYTPVRGDRTLREAVARHAARFYGQDIDPRTEVSITNGVTEALQAALASVLDPGDEVVVFEPFYDCYLPAIRMAGGTPVAVTLHAPKYRFDPDELRAAFSARTKAIVVNTPHNPTGTVFSVAELTRIAELCREFDVLAITDEVYEHVVFDGVRPVRMATLPGMWERTLTLSGAGKTFSCTGWRIGWAIGPAPLQEALCRLRQFTVFCAPAPLQFAVAAGFDLPDSYFEQLAAGYQQRRDFLMQSLAVCGLQPTRPAGSFFILTDTSRFPPSNAREFCHYLAREFGVAPVPTDTFYLRSDLAKNSARFTFCATRQNLETAASRLERLHASAPSNSEGRG